MSESDARAAAATTRLLEVMRRLRDPQTGCAWDREQTLESIVPHTLEEAHEVAEAMLSAAARGRTHFTYPSKYAVLWWLKRAMPQQFQKLLPKILQRST